MLTPILDQLEKQGMPVAFLRHVEAHVPIVAGPMDEMIMKDEVKKLSLSAATLRPLTNPVPDTLRGEGSAIHTLYHEGTHAFLYAKQAEPAVVRLREEARRYYSQNAWLKTGGSVSDPSRVVEEAAADYVGHRAALLWKTMEALAAARDVKRTLPQMTRLQVEEQVKTLADLPHHFNEQAGQLTFGYQKDYWGYGGRQVYTSKPISFALKDYCDQAILEHKVPDSFDALPKLVREHQELLAELEKLLPREQPVTY
ncbi:MAG: hypothetical protein J0L64_02625 [Acidobacteria bacterium]|nr:hypothetical protein [Acidobacteriota bacterium]